MFAYTTAIDKLLKMQARKKVVQGGTSAGKTYGIIAVLIDWCIKNPKKKVTVVAESIPAVKAGAVDIFRSIMEETGRWVEDRWLGNPMQYTFYNKTRIEFKSFDTEGKAKAAGKRDVLFLNEANHIPFNIADTLMIRSLQTWIDFNPDNEFWAHTEILQEPNSEFLLLKYNDNEALPPETLEDLQIKMTKAEAEAKAGVNGYWTNWVRVYIDGEIGSLQGAIFNNWHTIDSIPEGAKLIRHGLDFGYHPDPMGCISVFEYNGNLIARENLYQTHVGIAELVAILKKLEPAEIMCDNSQPMIIGELQKAGLRAKPCIKGKDSIEYGISKLQEKTIMVPKTSLNLINELRKYIYDPVTGSPIDMHNHLIDPLRYAYVLEPKSTVPIATARGRR